MNENKIIKGTGLLGRFLGGPVKLGDVYKKDGDDLNYFESIMDDILQSRGLESIPDNWITSSNSRDMKFIRDSGIEVGIGANATTHGVTGGLSLSFSKKNTGFIYLKNAVILTLALGEIKEDILKIWDAKDYEKQPRKFVLANKLIRAESGTVIFSSKGNNKIELQAKTPDVPLIDIEPVASGKVAILSSKFDYLEVISENQFEPLFGAVRVNSKDRFKAVD